MNNEALAKSKNSIIAIASGKGGVGKTFSAITISHALSMQDQRVLLFDGNLELANIDIQMGLIPKHSLDNVFNGTATLNQICIYDKTLGFDIIPGTSEMHNLEDLPKKKIDSLSEDLLLIAKRYDKITFHLASGMGYSVKKMAFMADSILLVTNHEPTALSDAFNFLKVMKNYNKKLNAQIIINESNSIREGERTFRMLKKICEEFLGISTALIGVIRTDINVKEAILNQAPLLKHSPECNAAIDIIEIAKKI